MNSLSDSCWLILLGDLNGPTGSLYFLWCSLEANRFAGSHLDLHAACAGRWLQVIRRVWDSEEGGTV